MNPVLELSSIARKVAQLGDRELAVRIQRAAKAAQTRQAAAVEVVLDSWTEFETWFLKNRSQGLEFVFEDKYGVDSQEVELVKGLLEGYDLVERNLHELYETLKAETPLPAVEEPAAEEVADEESLADETEAADAAEAESLADVLEETTGDEGAAEEAVAEEEVVEEEATEEEPSEGEVAAEEALAPSKAEASAKPDGTKTQEAKTITRLQKLLRKAKVEPVGITFSGNNSYRIQFADFDARVAGSVFLAKTGMTTDIIEHPVKMFLSVTP